MECRSETNEIEPKKRKITGAKKVPTLSSKARDLKVLQTIYEDFKSLYKYNNQVINMKNI